MKAGLLAAGALLSLSFSGEETTVDDIGKGSLIPIFWLMFEERLFG
jgi:hypothetical protein